MAGGALGSLTVKLGLDAVDFTAGLSKADYQAKQFGESIGLSHVESSPLTRSSYHAKQAQRSSRPLLQI